MQPAIEAILYTAGEAGVTLSDLAQVLSISEAACRQQLEVFTQKLANDDQRGLMVRAADDRYYLLTKPEYGDTLKRYFAGPPTQALSQAALEVLAIIAYQQPITRIEIDEVRGVQSSGSLTTLASRQLIKEAGRKDAPGRPILYATTPFFLDYFGLSDLSALPPIKENQTPGEVDLFAEAAQPFGPAAADATARPDDAAETDSTSEEAASHEEGESTDESRD